MTTRSLLSYLIVGFATLLFIGCLEQPNSFAKLPPGQWRGILKLSDPDQAINTSNSEDEKLTDYLELPFNLEVEYQGDDMNLYLINGEEKIQIEEVHYGRDPRTAKDTIRLSMNAFDTKMDGFYEDNYMEGYWVVNYKKNYKIPFVLTYGQTHRFLNRPIAETADFDGKWKVTFEYDTDDAYPAIAEFSQDKNELSGTFRTETGDYRYLAGNAYGDKLRLSVFDGSHAFLFRGSIENDTIYGEFQSGSHYKSKWLAVRDNAFELQDPYKMTTATSSAPISFSFPDANNQLVSLEDPLFKNKITLINIMGTWCPNCRDEVEFLKTYQEKYKDQIQVISIAFERYREAEKARKMIAQYQATMDFTWPILLGGYANKKETTEEFPYLDKIYSYPTLLMVDENRVIRNIHTGFNGPATSKFKSYKQDFEAKLNSLINE